MTCSLFVVFLVVWVFLSLVPDMSNAEFFRKYGLTQPAHLDQSAIKKLERAYRKCVAKLKSGRNTKTEQIPENLDIPSYLGLRFSGDPSLSKSVRLWTNNIIPTKLQKSVKTKLLEERLACAMLYFHSNTCIRFVKKQKSHKNYLLISNNGPFCSSDAVGMKSGKQTVNLAGTTNSDCWKHGVIVHELLHVIGTFHEHQRHDRDQNIDINYQYISPMLMPQFASIEQMGYENYDDIGQYDFSSVMHYGSKLGKHRLIVAKYSKYKFKAYGYTEQMGNRERPTDTDTFKVKELYQCDDSTTKKQKKTEDCKKTTCNFEDDDTCGYVDASITGSPPGFSTAFEVAQGRYKNFLTGVRWAPGRDRYGHYAATYLRAGDKGAILINEVDMRQDRVIRFKHFEATGGMELRACCDKVSNCPFTTSPFAQVSDRKWHTSSFMCQTGTNSIILICENKGSNQGACALDDIQMFVSESRVDPDKADELVC